MSIFHDNIREILEDAQRFLLVTLSKEVLSASAISHKQGLLSKIDRFRHDHPQLHLEKLAEDGDYLQSSSPQPYTDMHGNVGKVMNDENDRPAEISSLETNSDYETFGSESGERQDRRKITNNESGDHSSNDTSGLMSGYLAKKGKGNINTGGGHEKTRFCQSLCATMPGQKRKRAFDIEFKLKVIQYANLKSGEAAAKAFGVDPQNVRQWIKRKSEFVKLLSKKMEKGSLSKRKRLGGAGRKTMMPALDNVLLDWILTQRMKSLRVSRRSIREEAKRVFPALNDNELFDFKASRGWLDKFLKRNNLALRRQTTEVQKDPTQLFGKVASVVNFVGSAVKAKNIAHSEIVAMDETSLWFDTPSNMTVAPVRSKTIQLKSTGNEMAYATVVLAAKGDGTKLKPYVVFKKGIGDVKRLQETQGVIVRSTVNGWMNDELTSDWLKTVFTEFSSAHRLLAWDSYKCHISKSTKQEFSTYNATMVVIPAGCTKYIHAPDVCWNKPFKARVTELYDTWLAGNLDKQYEKGGGNLKAPSKKLMLDWVKSAWESIPRPLIVKSFKVCGLTVAPDGPEDDQILCLKPDQPCFPSFEILKSLRAADKLESLAFAEDEEENDCNEALIDESDLDDEIQSPSCCSESEYGSDI